MSGAALDIITIGRFRPDDQQAVRALIVAGLAEHWGHADESLNPDLRDIAASYAGATFLVARQNGTIVGTGALVPRSAEEAAIVRMSVARTARRLGLGTRLLDRLIAAAREQGFRRVILETTSSWDDVIAFYERYGFQRTHQVDGAFGSDTYFALDLGASDESR